MEDMITPAAGITLSSKPINALFIFGPDGPLVEFHQGGRIVLHAPEEVAAKAFLQSVMKLACECGLTADLRTRVEGEG